MPIHDAPNGTSVAECPRCDARSPASDVETARQWLAAHWRLHDHEIGCGRRATPPSR